MTHTNKTNFIFIVADDLGYADLGCYGSRANTSPCLDQLASAGVRFTNGYANSPVCSPTRFALMTACYQYWVRGASEEPMAGNAHGSQELGLFPHLATLPGMLKDGATTRHSLANGTWVLGRTSALRKAATCTTLALCLVV